MREITHLHYSSWPDFGTPAQPSHLLALVELANATQRVSLPIPTPRPGNSAPGPTSFAEGDSWQPSSAVGDGNQQSASRPRASDSRGRTISLGWHDEPESSDAVRPMLVHCSAGCGRTGTFCTVDSVIDMLKRQRLRTIQEANDKIAQRERHLRQQQLDDENTSQNPETDVEGDISMHDATDADLITSPVNVPEPTMSTSAARTTDTTSTTQPSDGDGTDVHDDDASIDVTWLGNDNIDLIAKTVEDFRGQRLSMVQSLRQFVLCYETVVEWAWRLQEHGGALPGRGRARSGSLAI